MNWVPPTGTNGLKTRPRRTKRLAERRPTAREHGDAVPLADFLEMVERVGVADHEYVKAYPDGFDGFSPPGKWSDPYRRGWFAGRDAKRRGAHGGGR